jgi:hypothetical protein
VAVIRLSWKVYHMIHVDTQACEGMSGQAYNAMHGVASSVEATTAQLDASEDPGALGGSPGSQEGMPAR